MKSGFITSAIFRERSRDKYGCYWCSHCCRVGMKEYLCIPENKIVMDEYGQRTEYYRCCNPVKGNTEE